MNQQLLMMQGLQADELAFLQQVTRQLTEAQEQQFYLLYANKRKDQQTLMLLCLLGVLGIAGIHRLVTGDTALGVIYLLTGGFCLVGTIIDLVNMKSLTYEFNRRMALETASLVGMIGK